MEARAPDSKLRVWGLIFTGAGIGLILLIATAAIGLIGFFLYLGWAFGGH
jgi:hypothetical protein